MNKNLVVVTGRIDPIKVKKKLKKKTGKRVEIVRNEDEEEAKDESHESDKLVVTQKPIICHHLQQLERTQIHGCDSRHLRTAIAPPSPCIIVSSLKQFHHRETIYHCESENQSAKKSKIA
ncbi:hypothetical protein LR48_Vigan04g119100 [Vigna angularis]|uniref:HMA domain-containing protein n=1 Tax=Phaseolus angularis TaxID=3914 RepID=A0A0L9UE36_PHAAN|nr:hypothetical protein LR48_Vigan04g119100 [Vigna angularis]